MPDRVRDSGVEESKGLNGMVHNVRAWYKNCEYIRTFVLPAISIGLELLQRTDIFDLQKRILVKFSYYREANGDKLRALSAPALEVEAKHSCAAVIKSGGGSRLRPAGRCFLHTTCKRHAHAHHVLESEVGQTNMKRHC